MFTPTVLFMGFVFNGPHDFEVAGSQFQKRMAHAIGLDLKTSREEARKRVVQESPYERVDLNSDSC